MSEHSLRADCARCCGLCCVGPAFQRTQGFGYDKPAQTPCINLGASGRCAIHPVREQLGFPACQGFDCFGAGQWVTQQLFGGASWRDGSPETAKSMFAAYSRFRTLHELLAMIDLVGGRGPSIAAAVRPLRTQVLQACALEQREPETNNLGALSRLIQGELRRIARNI